MKPGQNSGAWGLNKKRMRTKMTQKRRAVLSALMTELERINLAQASAPYVWVGIKLELIGKWQDAERVLL
jgi:hypothetical protein